MTLETNRRVFTQLEMDDLCKPVTDIFANALAQGHVDKAKDTYSRFAQWQIEVCIGIFGKWAAKYIEWVDREKGRVR